MSWKTCDSCKGAEYSDDNPFVEIRQKRPSDPSDMCCTMAGHLKCLSKSSSASLPQIGTGGGMATPQQWEEWIEGEGAEQGFAFLG